MASRIGGWEAAADRRIQTETQSRPVGGTSKASLTTCSGGPLLDIRRARAPVWCSAESSCTLVPGCRTSNQPGIWPSAPGASSKPGLRSTASGGGLPNTAARAPNARICAASLASTCCAGTTTGAARRTCGSEKQTATTSYGSSSTVQASPCSSVCSGAMLRVPVSSPIRHAGEACTPIRAEQAKAASLTT